MGSEESREVSGETIQSQGDGSLWSVVLTGKEGGETEAEGDYEVGEGCCVFSRTPGSGSEGIYCKTGVEHLRLLRHPNILKYIGSEVSMDTITMVTEPVFPVLYVLSDASLECVVMGWRGLANGLTFLHTKAGLSHNNLSLMCVYASTGNSQWKVGGLELAIKHSRIDHKFISAVAPLRYKKAIPPEDNTEATPTTPHTPHARDVWAFAHLILATVDKADLDDKVGDSLFLYVQDEMLNPDPCQRPTPSQVANKAWMRNQGSQAFEFLSHLTLKSPPEKNQFFAALPATLFSLPPLFVAEHLVPLLVTPLVLGEQGARNGVWKHLLSPVTDTSPRPKVFNRDRICPILPEDLFLDHVLPLVLNFFESRELHVRTVLLENLSCFASVCSQDELMESILPEVLLGLKDHRVEVVQATLHALGDLVPMVGTEAVLGRSSDQLFTDSKPRNAPLSVGSVSLPQNVAPSIARGSREERQQKMKLKKEQLRRQRQSQPKLGGKLAGKAHDSDTPDETTPTAPPFVEDHNSQYSPSISHDEEVPNDEVDDWEASTNKPNDWLPDQDNGRKEQDEDSEEWEDFGDDSGASVGGDSVRSGASVGGVWGDSVKSEANNPAPPPRTTSNSGRMKLKRTGSNTSSTQVSVASSDLRSPTSGLSGSSEGGRSPQVLSRESSAGFRNAMKGRLSETDLARLEAKRIYSVKEPDFFADMVPTLANSTQHTGDESSSNVGAPLGSRSSTHSEEPVTPGLTSALQYQPQNEEGQGWGEEDWSEF